MNPLIVGNDLGGPSRSITFRERALAKISSCDIVLSVHRKGVQVEDKLKIRDWNRVFWRDKIAIGRKQKAVNGARISQQRLLWLCAGTLNHKRHYIIGCGIPSLSTSAGEVNQISIGCIAAGLLSSSCGLS